MTPERWQQVKSVFAVAVTLDADARAYYLDTACSGDEELRREVDSLLDSNPAEGEFLDTPVMRLGPAWRPPASQMCGRRIGPYELFEELGIGGMGEVYRARRADGQYEHQVAIKLIRSGHEGGTVLQRFWTERQILATLDHPHIARLLDGGAADDGMPYLVMELIAGASICEYCDAHRLTITARLELFRQVCSAVQYAHQRLIVHRDIKPTNILVTSDGTPKLLDFGIAKILAPSSDTEQTLSRPMTLAYASPEQIRGETVTTASDVYSLGVVLYRLLTGRSPYRINASTPGGLYRAIEEDEPVRPSAAVTRPAADDLQGERELAPEDVSARRASSVAKLSRRLRGDLDDIVLKALRKEPDRRYVSVDQLSQDIDRHLNGFPVAARQGTWRYHADKFVRRHKAGMAAAALVALITAVGVAATLVEARLAAANARRAEQRFEQVRKLANAMVFDVHDAIQPLPGATKPRELIVRLGLEYLDELSRDPNADLSLQLQIAQGYMRLGQAQGEPGQPNLGDRAGAAASYRKAIDILDHVHARDPQNGAATRLLAAMLNRMTHVAASSAERWAYAGRSLQLRRADAAAHPTDLAAQRNLATSLFEAGVNYSRDQRYAEAVEPFQQARIIFQDIDRRAPSGNSARNVALCDKRLAALSLMNGDPQAALRGYEAARVIDERRAQDPQNAEARVDLAYDLSDIGTTLQRLSRWSDAAEAFDQAIAMRRDAYNADSNDDQARVALAAVLFRRGSLWHFRFHNPEAAIPLLREASRLWSLNRDDVNPERADAEYQLAEIYEQLGNPRQAETSRKTALAIYTQAATAAPLDPKQQLAFDAVRKRLNGAHSSPGGKVP